MELAQADNPVQQHDNDSPYDRADHWGRKVYDALALRSPGGAAKAALLRADTLGKTSTNARRAWRSRRGF